MSKGKIYEFDPVVYPRRLYVVKGDKSYMDEHFETKDGGEIDVDYDSAKAWVIEAYSKDDDRFCIVVWLENDVTAKDLAHESYHAVAAYFREIGAELPTDHNNEGAEETAAYLMGWIFDCLWQVKQGTVK